MEIPDSSVGWGLTAFSAIVAWLVRLEARLNARPTRQEQQAIAVRVAAEVNGQFAEIKRMLDKQNENTALHRELMGDAIAGIREKVTVISEKVAVLRDRAGDDPLGDTGAHRRRL